MLFFARQIVLGASEGPHIEKIAMEGATHIALVFGAILVWHAPQRARAGLPDPQFTGSGGGRDLNVHTRAAEGVVLLGRLKGSHDGKLVLASDRAENLAWGDEQAERRLRTIDEHIRQQGLDAPAADPPAYPRPAAEMAQGSPEQLNLADAGIGTVRAWCAAAQSRSVVRLRISTALARYSAAACHQSAGSELCQTNAG